MLDRMQRYLAQNQSDSEDDDEEDEGNDGIVDIDIAQVKYAYANEGPEFWPPLDEQWHNILIRDLVFRQRLYAKLKPFTLQQLKQICKDRKIRRGGTKKEPLLLRVTIYESIYRHCCKDKQFRRENRFNRSGYKYMAHAEARRNSTDLNVAGLRYYDPTSDLMEKQKRINYLKSEGYQYQATLACVYGYEVQPEDEPNYASVEQRIAAENRSWSF